MTPKRAVDPALKGWLDRVIIPALREKLEQEAQDDVDLAKAA